MPQFELVEEGIEIGKPQRLCDVAVMTPGGVELGAALQQLLHGLAGGNGGCLEGFHMHDPRVLRAGADLHGGLHFAQSFAYDGNLLAPPRLGRATTLQ